MLNPKKYTKLRDFEQILEEWNPDKERHKETEIPLANQSPLTNQTIGMDEKGNVYNTKTNKIYYNFYDESE
jgi:hypothetical protein